MKNRFWMLIAMGILLVVILLAGCGKNENAGKQNTTMDEGPWFETEFYDFKFEEDEFIPSFYIYENEIYFLVYSKAEDTTNRFITLKKMSLDNYSIVDLKSFTTNEVGVIINLCVEESGIYMTGQNIQWNQERTKVLDSEYKIITCEMDGTVRKYWDITEDMADKNSENEAVYLADIACDKEGNVFLTDNMTFVMAFDNQGEKIVDIDCDNWGNGFLASDNGEVYYSYTGGISMKQYLAPVDVKANKLGKKTGELASFMTFNYCIDANEKLWYSDENSLLTYDLKTEEKSKILNWIDYDITMDSVRMLEVMEDGSIVICVENLIQEQLAYEVAIFKETDKPLEEKTIITYATFGADTEIMEAIVRFNKNSEEYRVKVIDYYDEENYEDAWNEYNQAILEEGFADIVNVSWSNYKMMAEKGLYADLNEFMNADKDINREDYFENILAAYDVSGKLYAMPVSFSISTLVGKEKIWGNKDSISLDDVKLMMDDMPKDVAIIDSMSQMEFVFFMLQGSLDKFIDWENGECYFDSDEFVEIVNLSKKFPKKSDWDIFNNETVDKFRQDKILLYSCELYEIGEYQVTKAILGDEIVALGYPGANGGLIQTSSNLLAISEKSPNKEIAWNFVRSMISKEYQSNYIYYNIPIHKDAFEKQMESAMEKEYYVNENGKEVEISKTTYCYEDLEIELFAATKEEAAEYKKVIEGATTLATYDQQIMIIVEEELEAFWDNKKTAEEVSGIIQSRVKIYVNERR